MQLSLFFVDLNVTFNAKSEKETQLPTVPDTLLPTDQLIAKALVTVTTSVSKVSHVYEMFPNIITILVYSEFN